MQYHNRGCGEVCDSSVLGKAQCGSGGMIAWDRADRREEAAVADPQALVGRQMHQQLTCLHPNLRLELGLVEPQQHEVAGNA